MSRLESSRFRVTGPEEWRIQPARTCLDGEAVLIFDDSSVLRVSSRSRMSTLSYKTCHFSANARNTQFIYRDDAPDVGDEGEGILF